MWFSIYILLFLWSKYILEKVSSCYWRKRIPRLIGDRPHVLHIGDPDFEHINNEFSISNISENDGRPEAPAAQYITKVAIKLPDFWSDNPDLWFIHAKSAVRNAQITQSRTKFDRVVQELQKNIMVLVRGLILSSSSTSSTPYEDLKAKLVASYTLSRW